MGVLFAPNAGQATRRMLKNAAGDGAEYLKRSVEDVGQRAKDLVENGKKTVRLEEELPTNRLLCRCRLARGVWVNTQSHRTHAKVLLPSEAGGLCRARLL